MEPPTEEDSDNQLFAEKYYESETLHSRPFVTPDSDIPENLLHLWYASSKCVHFSSDKQMQHHSAAHQTLQLSVNPVN